LTEASHPFAYPQFRYFWWARLVTMLAQSSTVLAVGWLVYDVSRRSMSIEAASFRLGLIGLVQFLPLLVCTLVAGWASDRLERRRVVLGAVALQLACSAGLAGLVFGEVQRLEPYFVLAGGLGMVRAFYMPAMNAIAPNLVPRHVLPRAVAANAMAGRSGAILGPVLGGFAYALAPWAAFALSALLLTVSLACVMRIPPVDTHMGAAGEEGALTQIAAGFRYIQLNRLVLGAVTLDLFAVLLGGVTALLPVFARDVLAVGPGGLGLLRAAPAVGALGAAAMFTLRPLRHDVGVTMLCGVAVYGLAIAGFGLSRWLPLSLALLIVLGASDMISVYVRQSIVQMTTPDAMRGRVGAIGTLSVSASNELGEFESGLMASLLGPVAAVVTGGLCAVAVAVLWNRWFPELRATRTFAEITTRSE